MCFHYRKDMEVFPFYAGRPARDEVLKSSIPKVMAPALPHVPWCFFDHAIHADNHMLVLESTMLVLELGNSL